jgi:signal transduction histidine kinase
LLIIGADVRRIPADTLTSNDAMVATDLDLAAFLKNIQQLRPDTASVHIIIGNSPLEQFWAAEVRREFQPFMNGMNVTWLNELPFDKMMEKSASLTSRDAIFYLMVAVDVNGAPYSRALEKLRAVATAPIFGIGDYDMGRGIVGGPLIQSQMIGQQAAAAAIRIFRGESDIKIEPVKLSAPIYDWRELRKWGINDSLLPAGSTVRYREPTAWERYRWQIVMALAALVGQSLLIAGLFYQRARRRTAEIQARARIKELAFMNRRAAIGAMSASIAHEIKQPLTAIVTNSDVGLGWLDKATPNVSQATAALKRIANDAYRANRVVESVRAMFQKDEQSRDLIDVNDVVREVLAFLRVELEEHDITVRTALSDGKAKVLADRIQLQQVVLNLVRNAIEAMGTMNGKPRLLRIRSATDSREFMVTIADSGPGVDPDIANRLFEPFVTTKGSGMGMGLATPLSRPMAAACLWHPQTRMVPFLKLHSPSLESLVIYRGQPRISVLAVTGGTKKPLGDFAGHSQIPANVGFGSKADMCNAPTHVRFTPNSDRKSGHCTPHLTIRRNTPGNSIWFKWSREESNLRPSV